MVTNVINTTKPIFGKVLLPNNSYEVTVAFTKGQLNRTKILDIFPLYGPNRTLRPMQVNFRIKLPKHPHYVVRVLNDNDGNSKEVFTVADQVSSINNLRTPLTSEK